MTKIKHYIETIRTSWTWNHKLLLVTMSLAVAVVVQSGLIDPYIPRIEASNTFEYVKAPVEVATSTLATRVEERAQELYKQNEAMDLEQYRHEAIREINDELLSLTDESPFVDYEALKVKYGY